MKQTETQETVQGGSPALAPANSSAKSLLFKATPVLLCKIFGHKWEKKLHMDDEPSKKYYTIRHHQMKCCMRCGTPNPNYYL